FKRVVNSPARGIGKTTIEKLENLSISCGKNLLDTVDEAVRQKLVHVGALKKLLAFKNMILEFQNIVSSNGTLVDLYHKILDETQYVAKLKSENTTESLARIDNLDELHNAISHFQQERGEEASTQNFLEEIALVSDVDSMDDENAVTLMTLHISKGLEFPIVHMVGMEQGLFPSGQTIESGDPDEMEEERRLAYVGITRAQEKLFLTHAKSRKVWGADRRFPMSQFINELPKENLDLQLQDRKRPNFMNRYADSFSSTSKSEDFDYNQDSTHHYDEFSYDDMSQSSEFQTGMRVRHPTFGVGNIYKVEGQGDLQKVSVIFPNKSVRKFVVKYARLERV
ncbi:MAG: ATP-binding domain-containing protein, partial [Bdellovibrionales bacterium]|nr:ATP-binding domain-containing protein [Bdellovibrionales bacterium]